MRISTLTTATATVLMAIVSGASAETQAEYVPPRPIASPPTVYRHASTHTEGALRGAADLTRAAGESRFNSSLAQINLEEARRRRMENRKQYARDYFELRQLNRTSRFQQARRPTQQQLAKAREARLPQRLSARQFQPALAKLNWPAALERDVFASEREQINRAMAARTVQNSGTGSLHYQQISRLVAHLEHKLRAELRQMSTSDSIAARKFLKSVSFESRFPVSADINGLAVK